jgi:hypothetical protein
MSESLCPEFPYTSGGNWTEMEDYGGEHVHVV